MPARRARVTLIGQTAAMPDLVVMGSHDIALDVVLGALAEHGFTRAHDRGRQPGRRRGGRARRMRSRAGASRRSGDRRLQRASAAARTCAGEGLAAHAGLRATAPTTRASRAAAPPTRSRPRSPIDDCLMVNRNAGAGTRVLIDKLLARRAAARLQQPAALAQRGRRRGGAGPRRLGRSRSSRWRGSMASAFLPIAPEDYDFLLVESRREPPGRAGVPGCAARRGGARENPRARHAPRRCLICL